MADVNPIQLPGVLQQLRLVAGLRWLILKNGLRRKSNRWDLIGIVAAGVFSGLLVFGVCIGLFEVSSMLLNTNRAAWMVLPFWGIFRLVAVSASLRGGIWSQF